MNAQNIDHDRLFKELISTFFWEFIELFFPEILEYVEQDELTFFPEEVFNDVTTGEKRKIDLLAQVRFQNQDTFFLIHIENQASPQSQFNRRMFNYFARLHQKYTLPIYPIALFSFDTPQRPELDSYEINFPYRKVLEFNFATIQLNRLNWRAFLRQPNPIAAALMSKMQIAPEDRPRVKLECLRMLATLQLDPARTQLISGFVDTYLRLNEAEKITFQKDLENIGLAQEEKVMKIVTSWMEEGIVQGRTEERLALVLRLLRRQLGDISPPLVTQVESLSSEQLDVLFDAVFDFQTETDLAQWLESQSNN
ncbi:MAG: DUF4351 domain-containing protein [Jaaginema sp. PMC 1079.18]|nr:DUF4351 domain-containing protein [Jaaginema sp. PMC 1080.18]MEC4851828.1 DUF4351 domain-containing protein [Jaaginema sp. PMC 1079.18]MEC4865197.1 DUF4351 domain-containing protein [Jaaginema sp. PMC 1078.18]